MKYICALTMLFIVTSESGTRYTGDTFPKTIGAGANIKEDLKKLLLFQALLILTYLAAKKGYPKCFLKHLMQPMLHRL